MFEDSPDVAFVVEHAHDRQCAGGQQVIETDLLESGDWPRAQPGEGGCGGALWSADTGVLGNPIGRGLNCIEETRAGRRDLLVEGVVAKVAQNVVARGRRGNDAHRLFRLLDRGARGDEAFRLGT